MIRLLKTDDCFSCSMKSYKRRFIAWGWRKNIRTAGQADYFLHAAEDELPENATIKLASGQTVSAKRLAIHLVRRQEYLRSARKRHGQPLLELPTMRNLEAPGVFRVSEAALFYTRTYINGRYEGTITAEELDDLRMGLSKPPGVEWNIFAGTVGQLVEHDRINEALVLSKCLLIVRRKLLFQLILAPNLFSAHRARRDGDVAAMPAIQHREPHLHARCPCLGPSSSQRPWGGQADEQDFESTPSLRVDHRGPKQRSRPFISCFECGVAVSFDNG